MISLGVNIDHIATLRQARRAQEPDPVWAAVLSELGGASNVTIHLREDRRHIQNRDVELLRQMVSTKLNLEMADAPDVVSLALRTKPDQATLVPERRMELTTEGGLNVLKMGASLRKTLSRLKENQVVSGVFIEPDAEQVRSSKKAGAEFVEFHTGAYANAKSAKVRMQELKKLFAAAEMAHDLGLEVHAGHGLNYANIQDLVKMPYLFEVNIGHAIIARAVFTGLREAVNEMVELIRKSSLAS